MKYNENQLKAINHFEGNCCLLASAGSGKTSTIVERMKTLVNVHNVKQHNILAITFSKKAADNMLDKLGKEYEYVNIMTFHALGYRMLKEQKVIPPWDVMIKDWEANKIIEDICMGMGLVFDVRDVQVKDIQSYISAQKNNLIRVNDEQMKTYGMPYSFEAMCNIYIEYERNKNLKKKIDFDDMILKGYYLLLENEDVRKYYESIYPFILADECLPKCQLVKTDSGIKSIKVLYDRYNQGKDLPKALSYNINEDKFEYKRITWANKSENRKILKIKSEGMNIIRCTENHKILTQRGYIRADELIIGKDSLILDNVENQKAKYKLNNDQFQIMLGSFLGDGCLRKQSKFNTFRLSITHGERQFPYLEEKISAFDLKYSVIKSGYTGKKSIYKSDFTKVFLLEKNIWEHLKELEALGLAIWYQDDGSFSKNKDITISTNNLTYNQNKYLRYILINKFDIHCEISFTKNKYYYLRFNVENSKKLLKLVSPYMSKHMQYKTNIDISNNKLNYNNKYLNHGGNYVKSVEFDGYEDVYDIEVEDNHNFVTNRFKNNTASGVVVHNCQDTNKSQYEILKLLAGNNNNLFVVGDALQNIFSWRGCDNSYFMNFYKHWKDTTVISLNTNYRSTDNIVKYANKLVKGIPETQHLYYEESKAFKKKYKNPEYKLYDNPFMEALMISSTIKDMTSNKKYKYKDFAILTRTNAQLQEFEHALFYNKIPYINVNGFSFYDKKEIRCLLSYLRLTDNGDNDVAFRDIYNVPNRYLGKVFMDEINEFATKNRCSLFKSSILFHRSNEWRYKTGVNELVSVIASLKKQDLDESVKNVGEIVKYLRRITGYDKFITKDSESSDTIDNKIDNLNQFEKFCEDFKDISSLLKKIDEIIAFSNKDEKDSNKVVLMTIHRSKGLEYPVIFLPSINQGILPHGKTNDKDEELRLLYVGMTRAEKELYISSVECNRSGNLQQSEFLDKIFTKRQLNPNDYSKKIII